MWTAVKLNRSQLQNEVSDMESQKKPHKKAVCCDFRHWLRLWLLLLGHRRSYWKWNAAYLPAATDLTFLITDKGQSVAVVELFGLADTNKWLNKLDPVARLYVFYICAIATNVDTGVMRPQPEVFNSRSLLRTFWHKDSGKGVSWHAHKLRRLIIKWLNERNAESGWKFRRVCAGLIMCWQNLVTLTRCH